MQSKNVDMDSESISRISVESFKQLIAKVKANKNIRNPFAFYTGILKCKLKSQQVNDLFMSVFEG